MRKLLLVVLIVASATVTMAQPIIHSSLGKEFYGMVMKNSGAAGPEYFRVFLSCPFATNAELSITDGSYDTTFAIIPNIVSTVNLPLSVEDTSIEIPTRQAIHVVADTDISVYVIYHKLFSSDSYMALPVESLGSQYTAVCYTSCNDDTLFGSDHKASEFGIVATEDNTNVTITPSSTTSKQHPVGIPFTQILNKGETYLVYGDPNDTTGDLTGSSVIATLPIAFLSGHDRTEIFHNLGQSRNCLVEQIPSNGTLGTSFITAPYTGRPYPVPDYFRIVAPIDSTTISINGTIVANINAGQFYEDTSTQPLQIQTNNAVVVAQYSQSETDTSGNYIGSTPSRYLRWSWDPTMLIVPPTQQFLSSYIFSNQVDEAFDSNFINVVIPDTAVGSVSLDGGNVSAPFITIPGSGFSYSQIYLLQGSHHISASAPFGLYMYGIGPADAYANTGGAAFKVLNGLLVTTNDIDYGKVWVDSCKDSTIMFENIGAAPITVWKLSFADSGAADFTITGGAPPFTIAPGDSHIVRVKFCPSAPGKRGIVNVQITSNAAEHPVITLHGIGSSYPMLEAVTKLVDYHRVKIGETKDSLIALQNYGMLTASVSQYRITGMNQTDFIIEPTPVPPDSVPAGKNSSIKVGFAPQSLGSKQAWLTVTSNDSAGTENDVELIGDATQSSYTVITSTDTIYGNVGDTINVPVQLLTPLDSADINKYHVTLSYDSTMLWPLGVSVDSTWSGGNFNPQYVFKIGASDVQAFASNSTLIGAGTLFNIQMLVLLGDAMQTPLNLSAVRYTDILNDSTAVNSSLRQGIFILQNYCAGQAGLIEASGNYALGTVNPNPITAAAQVTYDIAIPGVVQLGLYNMLGQETLPIVNGVEGAGHYVAFIPANTLPQGSYLLVLKSGKYRESKRVVVVR